MRHPCRRYILPSAKIARHSRHLREAVLVQPQITSKIQTQISSTHRFDHNKTNSNIGNTGGTNSGLQRLVRLVSQMGKSPYVARVCWHLVRLFSATHLPCAKGKGVPSELISNKTPLTVSKGYSVLYFVG